MVVVWEMKLVTVSGLQHICKLTAALRGCSQHPAVPLGVFTMSWDVFTLSVCFIVLIKMRKEGKFHLLP